MVSKLKVAFQWRFQGRDSHPFSLSLGPNTDASSAAPFRGRGRGKQAPSALRPPAAARLSLAPGAEGPPPGPRQGAGRAGAGQHLGWAVRWPRKREAGAERGRGAAT